MVEELLPNLYRMEIPLPKSPLKALNSYLIKARGRFLIIDTGMNRDECRRAMLSDLAKLGVDLKRTDFFITHIHTDHCGLVANLATDTSTVYFNQKEASASSFYEYWQAMKGHYRSGGFPEEELEKSLKYHPGYRYESEGRVDFSILKEGDTIEIGDYCFRCIETPGHSPGHMCLYEADKKILISGDHILLDITPNISLWAEDGNPLREYLASLDKVYALEVDLVLPGHRSIATDHRKRITELKHHHRARLSEILAILESGEKNAFQISSRVRWNLDYSSWELFPSIQKWFAVGETLSHLKYLEEDGLVRTRMKGHQTVFSPV